MTDADIVTTLGVEHLAAMFAKTPSSIRNWKARGIPWKHRIKVHAMAKRRGITLPGDWLTRENRCG